MAEVLVSYTTHIADHLGAYQARAVGRPGTDGRWEGWIEFEPLDGEAEVLVTSVESHQPEREHLVYWATGLTPVYLEGALRRARDPIPVRVRIPERPASEAPAPRPVVASPVVRRKPDVVLDPFEVGSRSLDILRQELTALNRPRLENIIAAYDMNPGAQPVNLLSDGQLIEIIVAEVDARLPNRR